MAELEEFVQGQLFEVAARTDEFAGTALGSQHLPIDPDIDAGKLRSWFEDQRLEAERAAFDPQTPDDARQSWSWTRDYYDQLIKALDAGMNPLAESNEQIAYIQITKVDHHYATWPVEHADEVAAAAADGYVLVPPRPDAENQLDLFLGLQDGLLQKLSDPEFFQSAEEAGLDAFTPPVRARIEADDAFLGPESLRSLAGGDIPPPLPAADFADSAGEADIRSLFRTPSEPEDVYPEGSGRYADLYRSADPPNTLDRAHATRYLPGPPGGRSLPEGGFGRLSQGWSQYPFSHRERILNALSSGEALSPDHLAALESGQEGYRAGEGGLSSSQYRAMVDMISDLGDRYRRTRWHMHGWRRQRLLQLIEMLDWATAVV